MALRKLAHPPRASAERDTGRDRFFALVSGLTVDPVVRRWLAKPDGAASTYRAAVTGGMATNYHLGPSRLIPTLDWDVVLCVSVPPHVRGVEDNLLREVGTDIARELEAALPSARVYCELCNRAYKDRQGQVHRVGHVFVEDSVYGRESVVDVVVSDRDVVLDTREGVRYVSLEWLVDDLLDIVEHAADNDAARVEKARRKLAAFCDLVDEVRHSVRRS